MGRVPQEHKDRANEHLEGTKNWFSEEYFPEERRDQFIYRAKKVIVECQRHDDYQASIKWLLGLLRGVLRTRTECRQAQGASVDTVKDHQQLNDALGELRTLLERFAGGKSTSEMMDRIRVLFDDSKKDEQLRAWFKDVDAYARKVRCRPNSKEIVLLKLVLVPPRAWLRPSRRVQHARRPDSRHRTPNSTTVATRTTSMASSTRSANSSLRSRTTTSTRASRRIGHGSRRTFCATMRAT